MSAVMKWIGLALTAVLLAGTVAGCVSDADATENCRYLRHRQALSECPAVTSSGAPQNTVRTATLRYYGGPKSPMWAGQ